MTCIRVSINGKKTVNVDYVGASREQIMKLLKYSEYATQDLRYEGKVTEHEIVLISDCFILSFLFPKGKLLIQFAF